MGAPAGYSYQADMSTDLVTCLENYGATKQEILLFDRADYRSINYLSLIQPDAQTPLPDGVIEVDCHPILYFMDADSLARQPPARASQIRDTLNILACRDERAALAVVHPGALHVCAIQPFPCEVQESAASPEFHKVNTEQPKFIRDLIEGTSRISRLIYRETGTERSVHEHLFSLLKNVGTELNKTPALRNQHEIIHTLIGRALLTRFLLDRGIITPETFPELPDKCDPRGSFENPTCAAITNKWLDEIFNGDMLKLSVRKAQYHEWFNSLDDVVFKQLSYILHHTDAHGQMHLPGFISFAHVPVGILSEVYERYAHENLDPEVRRSARSESIHYTPRHIAEYMLTQAFDGIEDNQRHKSCVLDPACGAGIFIVLAFRRLVAEHWKATRRRPDTQVIRNILYKQLAGFDINGTALTLSALGLYLSALELDPDPTPVSKLRFGQKLLGTVLHNTRGEDEPWQENSHVMGSLGKQGDSNSQRYDIVIGNPPWSGFPSRMRGELSDCVRDVARRRCADAEIQHIADNYENPDQVPDLPYADADIRNIADNYENPDQVPDLPFVWKSMDWARPGGIIALVLHARLLFKRSVRGTQARADLFKALNVTGILNGSAMRKSRVWPRSSAPFCLLFARNEIPDKRAAFQFISPQYEESLNQHQGRIRIDHQSAELVQPGVLEEKPYLLKTLYKGTALDVHVMDHLQSLFSTGEKIEQAFPLNKYWQNFCGSNRSGTGYISGNKGKDASSLCAMHALHLKDEDNQEYFINPDQLGTFDLPKLEGPRQKKIYEPPLVLIKQSISTDRTKGPAFIYTGPKPLIYNSSFYGYSTHECPDKENLAEYLFIILNSDLFVYYMLMISAKYGVERDVFYFSDVGQFPVIPYDGLPKIQKEKMQAIYNRFKHNPDRKSLNKWTFSLYGLNVYEQEVIKDTLDVSLPGRTARKNAQKEVRRGDIERFHDSLSKTLIPYRMKIQPDTIEFNSWKFITISRQGNTDDSILLPERGDISKAAIYKMAEDVGASKILIPRDDCIHIGLLNQYRYWTPSRARLLALQLLEEYSEFFQKIS